MEKYEVVNLEVDWKLPTVKQAFPHMDFLIIMDNGRVRNFNTDFGGMEYYDSIHRFKEATGLEDEFDLMYEHDPNMTKLLKENYEGIQIVYKGHM